MSNSSTPLNGQVGSAIIQIPSVTSTAEADVIPGSGTLFRVQGDNTANTTAKSYLKLYDAAAPTVGTTAPDWIFRLTAGKKETFIVGGGIGTALATGLSIACVTAAGTGGTTSPTNAVPAKAHV